MPPFDTTPIPEISTHRLRANLRAHVEQVATSGARLLITRHGRAVAALVPAHEGRALWNVAHNDEVYSEWRVMQKLNRERDLRMAVMEENRRQSRQACDAARDAGDWPGG